jgi:6-phosphogluconolactonase
MNQPRLEIFADTGQLAAAAARLVSQCAAESIRQRGQFTLALAGGSTPQKTYMLLADEPTSAPIDWSKTWLFFGDERYVPRDDPRSNYHMAYEALLTKAAIGANHVFPIPTELPSVDRCAMKYEQTLAEFFKMAPGEMPVFDLILLGLGDDGHTASLFPGAAALEVVDRAVMFSPPGVLPPPVDRVTLTFPALNAARHVAFLVAGANKAEPLGDVWQGRSAVAQRPAAGIRPENGQLTWLVDRAAAARLPPNSGTSQSSI